MRLLERAILGLCTTECVELLDPETRKHLKSFTCRPNSSEDKMMTTWEPSDCLQLLLITLPDGNTAIYFPAIKDQRLFYANSSVSLHRQSFEGPTTHKTSILMGYYTEDHIDQYSRQARVLINDILMHDNQLYTDTDPEKRHHTLRSVYEGRITRPVTIIQWVGYYSYAKSLLEQPKFIQHKVGKLISLTNNPLKRSLPVDVTVPDIDHTKLEKDIQKQLSKDISKSPLEMKSATLAICLNT